MIPLLLYSTVISSSAVCFLKKKKFKTQKSCHFPTEYLQLIFQEAMFFVIVFFLNPDTVCVGLFYKAILYCI
jgi:hypothetical protein